MRIKVFLPLESAGRLCAAWRGLNERREHALRRDALAAMPARDQVDAGMSSASVWLEVNRQQHPSRRSDDLE